MDITVNIVKERALCTFERLKKDSLFIMPAYGLNDNNELFIKISHNIALMFTKNGLERIDVTNDIWVSEVNSIKIDVM